MPITLDVKEKVFMYPHNKKLTVNAQNLRREMTPQERHLWYDFLKKVPLTIKRQYVLENYILDFFIPSVKIAIEIDGAQHFDPQAKQADKCRDELLNSYGIKVLRYTNLDINRNFDGVASDILRNVGLEYSDLSV